MLTKADEYPIHQTPDPIAFSGSDRNFYDRYFFNGYSTDGAVFFGAALGVYPQLGIMDAAFSVRIGGQQYNLHASRHMHMERTDTQVGPIRVEVIEPLKQLRVVVEDNEHGISADLTITGPHVERELALVKVKGTGDHRIEALRLAEVYRARGVDATTSSFVFEVTGGSDKIDKFLELMRELGLVEVARTGVAAMARGAEAA